MADPSDSPVSPPLQIVSNIIDTWKLRHPSYLPLLPADFFPVIGRIAVAWGFFEAAFEQFLVALTKAEGVPDDDWRGFSFRRRRDLFGRLMAKALGDCPGAIQLGAEIIRDSEPAYLKRNLVVHGRLATHFQAGAQSVSLVCVGRVNRKEVTGVFTTDQLDDLFYEIAHVHGRLHLLKTGNLGQPPSSFETLRLQDFLAMNHPPDPILPTLPSPPQSSQM